MQTFIYYQKYPDDKKFVKLLVRDTRCFVASMRHLSDHCVQVLMIMYAAR